MFEAELPRTRNSRILDAIALTITLPARNALMALPYWPSRRARLMSSMRVVRDSVRRRRSIGAQDLDAVVASA